MDHYAWSCVVKEKNFNTEVCSFDSVFNFANSVEIIQLRLILQLLMQTASPVLIIDRYDTFFTVGNV